MKTAESTKDDILRVVGSWLVHKDAARLGKEVEDFIKTSQRDALLEAAEIVKLKCLVEDNEALFGPHETLIAYKAIHKRAKEI